jgi:hypothetical protein
VFFGVLEILKAKMDWICGAVEKERNAQNFGLGIVLGKGQLEPKKQLEAESYLGYLWKRVVGGRSKIVVVVCLDQRGTTVDVVAVFSTHILPQERRFCGHECCKESGMFLFFKI